MEQIINNNNDEIMKLHEQSFLDDISKNGRFCLSIGKAIAKSFVDAGAQVMLTSRKEDALRAAANEMDGETEIFAANAGDIEQGQACVDATMNRD